MGIHSWVPPYSKASSSGEPLSLSAFTSTMQCRSAVCCCWFSSLLLYSSLDNVAIRLRQIEKLFRSLPGRKRVRRKREEERRGMLGYVRHIRRRRRRPLRCQFSSLPSEKRKNRPNMTDETYQRTSRQIPLITCPTLSPEPKKIYLRTESWPSL